MRLNIFIGLVLVTAVTFFGSGIDGFPIEKVVDKFIQDQMNIEVGRGKENAVSVPDKPTPLFSDWENVKYPNFFSLSNLASTPSSTTLATDAMAESEFEVWEYEEIFLEFEIEEESVLENAERGDNDNPDGGKNVVSRNVITATMMKLTFVSVELSNNYLGPSAETDM